jgi:transcriptional regulator with XRE-family HTH domain
MMGGMIRRSSGRETTLTFGQKIEQLRKQRNMTLRKLAEKSGISYSLIQSMINDERVPAKEAISSLARALLYEDTEELFQLAGY